MLAAYIYERENPETIKNQGIENDNEHCRLAGSAHCRFQYPDFFMGLKSNVAYVSHSQRFLILTLVLFSCPNLQDLRSYSKLTTCQVISGMSKLQTPNSKLLLSKLQTPNSKLQTPSLQTPSLQTTHSPVPRTFSAIFFQPESCLGGEFPQR